MLQPFAQILCPFSMQIFSLCSSLSSPTAYRNPIRAKAIQLPPCLSMSLLSTVSVIHGQPWSKNIKWKILEIKNSSVLNCMLFWASWWDLKPSRSILPQEVNHPVVQRRHYTHSLPISHLVSLLVSRQTDAVLQCLCSRNTYFTY